MTWIHRGSVMVWDGPAEALDPPPRQRRGRKPRTGVTKPKVDGLNGKEAARAAGVTYRQLDFWTRRGYLQAAPRPEGSGSGCVRTYTADEVRIAAWMGVLTAFGLAPDAAEPIARDLEATGRATFGPLSLTFEEAS